MILGQPDGDVSESAKKSTVRIRYVETLRTQASLINERYAQQGVASLPTSSLQQPNSVVADVFRVYVTDQSPVPRLAIFDRTARTLTMYSAPTPTELGIRFVDLASVAVADSGEIVLADAQQGKIFGLDREGRLIFTIGKTGALAYPAAVAVDSRRQRLYVADKHAHMLRMYRLNGDWLQDITGGDAKKRITSPMALALDAAGTCYVLDAYEHRIHVIDADGLWRSSFRIKTDLAGEAVRPSGIAVDSDGHLYVTDTFGNSILLFDRNGMFLQRWGGIGNQPDGFWAPSAIFIDGRDYIYVADRVNGRIQVYQYEK